MAMDFTKDPRREERSHEAVAAYLEAMEAGRVLDTKAFLASYADVAAELETFLASQNQLRTLFQPLRAPDHPGDGTVSRVFGTYILLQELGSGGMGVVYKARQASVDRLVALKMIRTGGWASKADIQRFRNEVRAVAELEHPHIVPVYEVVERQGAHYYTMRLLEGGSLAEHVPRFVSKPRTAAQVLGTVARAVHHAHQHGILHRDLKPANILFDKAGRPYVTDFGLAKRVSQETALTETGAIVGTPSYMAPEQACPRAGSEKSSAVTAAADVYSLGAILYEMLTGRPPFEGDTALEILQQVVERDPERPRSLNPGVDRDLETICLKCLDKRLHRRYDSAEALAEDLESWLERKPIKARPIGRTERLWLWCRRKPVVAGLSAMAGSLMVLLGVMAIISHYQTREVVALKDVASREEKRGNEQEAARIRIEQERSKEAAELAKKDAAARAASTYFADMRKAAELVDAGDTVAAGKLLEQHRPPPGSRAPVGWEWYFLNARCRSQASRSPLRISVQGGLAWSADSKHVVGVPDMLKNWDILGQPKPDWAIQFCDAITGEVTRKLGKAGNQDGVRPDPISVVQESSDGRWLASGSFAGLLQLWNTHTGEAFTLAAPSKGTLDDRLILSWSPDGKLMASASERDTSIHLWDRATRKPVRTLPGYGKALRSLAWSPDGKHLASAWLDATVRVWDTNSGEVSLELPFVVKHEGGGTPIAPQVFSILTWSPDGRRLAVAEDDASIKVWDMPDGKEITTLAGHQARIFALAWNPDGKSVVSASSDGEFLLWDTALWRVVLALRKAARGTFDPDWVRLRDGRGGALAWSPDGWQLGFFGEAGAVKIWDATPQ